MMKERVGIYVHIPFCEKKCNYCSFYSVAEKENVIDEYVNELIFEIIAAAKAYPDKTISTLYVGGGTPSLLSINQFSRIVNAVGKYFHLDLTEFTVEVNPNSASQIAEYRKFGVDRISVGVQSTDDAILRKLGRLHTADEAVSTLEKAAEHYPKVNADLILGVEEKQDVLADFSTILPYVNHLSAYLLSVENGTPLKQAIDEKKISVATEDGVIEQYNELYFLCRDHDLYRYEVSNFSRLGAESKHNLNYWSLGEYIGFGPGAHSYMNGVRYYNRPSITQYLAGKNFAYGGEVKERKASLEEDKKEYIMLALRTAHGVDFSDYFARFKEDFLSTFYEKIKKMDEYLFVTDHNLGIRPQYFLVQNAIIGELL